MSKNSIVQNNWKQYIHISGKPNVSQLTLWCSSYKYRWHTLILFLATIIIGIPWSYFWQRLSLLYPDLILWRWLSLLYPDLILWRWLLLVYPGLILWRWLLLLYPGLILWRWLLLLYPGLILSYFVPRHRCMEKEMDLCMALQLSPERCPRTASSGAPVAGKRAPSTMWKCCGGPACGSRRFQGDEKPQTHFWVVVTS